MNSARKFYLGVAALAVVALGVTSIATATTGTSSTPESPSGILLGSYNGAADPAANVAFSNETTTPPDIYSDYLDGSSWSAMVGTPGNPPWLVNTLNGQLGNQRLLLSVPLVHAGYSSDQAALAAYAANPSQWDANFTTLAQNLVADGMGNAIIRLMWEPDSGIYSNEDLTSAANYATLWRDAHTAMAAVSGADFQWAWYWGGNFDNTTNTTAYPGSAYVDYITFDFYDQSWDGACGVPYNGSDFTSTQESCLWTDDYSKVLRGLSDFATIQQKPIGIGEWGVIARTDGHGGGDDPLFVNNFVTWMEANHVTWASYFNFNDSGGDSGLSGFPNSMKAYIADLGAGATPPTSTTSSTTTTTAPPSTTSTTIDPPTSTTTTTTSGTTGTTTPTPMSVSCSGTYTPGQANFGLNCSTSQ